MLVKILFKMIHSSIKIIIYKVLILEERLQKLWINIHKK